MSRPREFWLHIHNTEPEEALELAIMAEQQGYTGVLSDDHWFMPAGSSDFDPNEAAPLPWDTIFPDIFALGGAIAASTKTLRYGCCIMVLANRTNPFLVAKQCSTLARLSNDRFIFGVGTGWMREEYRLAGVDWKTRVPRTLEMIDILRSLWGAGPTEYHGKHFDFRPTYALPTPRKPIPVYMGSVVPDALRRTGRIADGWMGSTARVEDIAQRIALINEGRREAGRDHLPFEFMCGMGRFPDGSLPPLSDYLRAEEAGVTQHHVGPIDHILGKQHTSWDEKRRFTEDFANRIIAKAC